MHLQSHPAFEPTPSGSETSFLKNKAPGTGVHQQIPPTSRALMGQIQNEQHPSHHPHNCSVVLALFSPEILPVATTRGIWLSVRSRWWPPPSAAGCRQAEWLPEQCQVVIKPPDTRDRSARGEQGRGKTRPPNARNHMVCLPASRHPPHCRLLRLKGSSLERIQIK